MNVHSPPPPTTGTPFHVRAPPPVRQKKDLIMLDEKGLTVRTWYRAPRPCATAGRNSAGLGQYRETTVWQTAGFGEVAFGGAGSRDAGYRARVDWLGANDLI